MYHKILDKDGNVIGISGNDDAVEDEDWIEITEEEYKLLDEEINKLLN